MAVALGASLFRWYLQGSGNVYTALSKRFYVPDPDLSWRVSPQHPLWLGLDVCAVIAALAIALAGLGVVTRRLENARAARLRYLRLTAWGFASVSLAVPAAAFASGAEPLRARDTLPASATVLLEDGVEGAFDAPPGRYVVVSHPGTAVTARLSAGGETFDARFSDISGFWRGSPRELERSMRGDISVAAASVDTGVGKRTRHARDGYLHAAEYPRIGVTFDRLAAVRADGPGTIAFRAPGMVSLMGRTHRVSITGTVKKLDPAAGARLAVTGDVLLVQADFALPIRETALAADAGDFDSPVIPVHVSLVLQRAGDPPP